MGENKESVHVTALFNNLLTAVLMALFIGLGVYVKTQHDYWNVACTIVGTVVGLIGGVAFANQDEGITRRELASERGVDALFLRPLTLMRGAEQIRRLQLPFQQTILVILLMATALMSAAIVALFGIRLVMEEIFNPRPSFPLSDLGRQATYLVSGKDGALYAGRDPSYTTPVNQLSGFLYKSAYITGLETQNRYDNNDPSMPYLPKQGSLGDTMYGSLDTGGLGLNVASYLQFSGLSDGFNMPANYEFNKLQASIYGTNIKWTPGGPNFTFADSEVQWVSLGRLTIGSYVHIDTETDLPTHILSFYEGIFPQPSVLESYYDGQDYLSEASVASSVSPLQMERKIGLGYRLSPLWKQKLANTTQALLFDTGGNLALGFSDAKFRLDNGAVEGDDMNRMARAIETVLGQLGEAYMSLLRQTVERTNVYSVDSSVGSSEANESQLRCFVTVQRLGGAQYAWLAVLGMMLIGALMGAFRACFGGKSVDFEAQDAVKLLRSCLKDNSVRDTSRVCYKDGIEVRTDDAGAKSGTGSD